MFVRRMAFVAISPSLHHFYVFCCNLFAAATVDERVRLAKLLQEVLSSARRARTFHRQVTELLAAYGVVVDAATELTLRIEEKLVAGGEGIASAAAASKA